MRVAQVINQNSNPGTAHDYLNFFNSYSVSTLFLLDNLICMKQKQKHEEAGDLNFVEINTK